MASPRAKTKLIFIAGPTASGKSGLALRLAQSLDAEIINADAIQVYRDLNILSARPDEGDAQAVTHHLYGHVDGSERYSAGKWASAAADAINDIATKGKAAIVVGGTGLYFRALEEGLSPIPDIETSLMDDAQRHRQAVGIDAFYREVVARDPAMARLDPADAQRQIRAWCVYQQTGVPLSVYQAMPREPLIDKPVSARIVIEPLRADLYAKCNARFDVMMENGAMDEAVALHARGLPQTLPVMRALGARELLGHLAGDASLEDAIAMAKQNTRRFAKRQLTWFRNQTTDWPVAQTPEDAFSVLS